MRCRKVRSYLSAYCNNELSGRKRLSIREHLAVCSGCHREEQAFLSIREAGSQLEEMTVSDDFNLKLLNRIGRERFTEAREKAYMPRRAPLFSWRQLVPAMSAVAVLLIVGVTWLAPGNAPLGPQAKTQSESPDWMSAQPTNNPNMTGALDKDWSLDKQLRRSNQMARLSSGIMDGSGFGNLHMASSLDRQANYPEMRVPMVLIIHRLQPVIRVYQSSPNTNAVEDSQVY